MGKYLVVLEARAKQEIKTLYKSGDKASVKKLEKILVELSRTPFDGIGNPEPLKHELTGFWS